MPWIFLYIQPCCHRQGIDSGLKKWRLHVDLHFGHGWVFNSLDLSDWKIIWRHGLLFLNRFKEAISCDSSFHHGHMEIGEEGFVWSWIISRVDYAPILQWRLAKCWNNLFHKSCHLPHFLCVSLFLSCFSRNFHWGMVFWQFNWCSPRAWHIQWHPCPRRLALSLKLYQIPPRHRFFTRYMLDLPPWQIKVYRDYNPGGKC